MQPKLCALRDLLTLLLSTALLGGCLAPTALEPDLVAEGPRVDGIEVELATDNQLRLAAYGSDGQGGRVTYAWGSRALSPPAIGQSLITVDQGLIEGMGPIAHLVVQDEAGRITGASVSASGPGSYIHTLVATTSAEPCVASHDRCIGRCAIEDATGALDATCAEDCLVLVALCRANPS